MQNPNEISDNYQRMLVNTAKAIRQQAELMLEFAKQYEEFLLIMYGDPKPDQKVVGIMGNKQKIKGE